MTMRWRSSFGVLSLIILTGCSIQPVQQGATNVKTADIVEHIRCETKAAIRQKTQDLLFSFTDPSGEHDQNALELAKYLRENPERYVDWPKYRPANERFVEFYRKYVETGIAFEFTFDIKEDNSVGGGIDPVGLLSHGIVKVPLSASGDFSRQNVRKFIVSDTFHALFLRNCPEASDVPNYAYPISGSIGIYSIIDDFIDLYEKEVLQKHENDKVNEKIIPVYTDSMTFQTTVMGGVNSTIVLSPSGHGVRIGDAGLTGGVSRVDKHAVLVALSFEPLDPKNVPRFSTSPLGGIQPLQTVYARTNIKSGAEKRAVNALMQYKIDNFLDRAAIVVP